MNKLTVLWEPFWYTMDYSIAVGEIGCFKFVQAAQMLKFTTTGDEEQGKELKVKILKISNAELGNIIKIDTTLFLYLICFIQTMSTIYK